jgi:hypothetical protein
MIQEFPMHTHPQTAPLVYTGGALTGGLLGAVIGSVFGPLGTALGAAAGGFTGAAAGEQIGEAMDHREDLIHLGGTFSEQDYYVSEMEWEDYEPAYRYGFDTYRTHAHLGTTQAKQAMRGDWELYNRHSHLSWNQAWEAVLHAWALNQERHAGQH